MKRAALLLIALLAAGDASRAEKVDYTRQIKPLLKEHCVRCHGPLKQESDLRLDTAKLMLEGGYRGAAIVPGQPGKSPIVEALTGEGDIERMPLEAKALAKDEIELVQAWIEQGAEAPDDEVAVDATEHWSYQVPQRPEVPTIARKEWVRNPIDAFIGAKHEELGLEPAPEAPKHILLRRVYLDLIGLPPTREELHAFLNDDSPEAYEKVVDRLLDSPRYGERWGRHWMDVWRYSDWYGYKEQVRRSQPHIWRWRDWIIESLNADKGYDRMVMEMLAGDELAPGDPDVVRATGYLVRNWYKFNRNVWLQDTVDHTAKAFLGVTLACTRCHDHMYDPIPQEAYYRFRAFFEPHEIRTDRVPGQPDTAKAGLVRVYDAKPDAKTYLFERGNEDAPDKEHPLDPSVPAALGGAELTIEPVALPVESYYPALREHVQQETIADAEAEIEKARNALAAAEKTRSEVAAGVAAAENAADSPQEKPAEGEKPAGEVVLEDDFREPQPKLWEQGEGDWHYVDGHLEQRRVVKDRSALVSKATHPENFRAALRFKITGGKTYHSVGIDFDRTGEDFQTVYLSAHPPGPKVQLAYTTGGETNYLPEARAAYPVEVGGTYELEVAVRGQLVNVFVDGEFVLAWTLPAARQEGRISVWSFDTGAEFHHLRVERLRDDVKLAAAAPEKAPVQKKRPADELTLEEAEAAVAAAARRLEISRARLKSVQARIAAERAKYDLDEDADFEALARAASGAQRELAALEAANAVEKAEAALEEAKRKAATTPEDKKAAEAVTKAEKHLDAARKKHEEAQAALDKDGSDYIPLGTVYQKTSTGRRLALAEWIASEQNPLTARVAVNHIWLRYFDEGLVPTVFDFGLNGTRPSHPELLDWLAVEFMEGSWTMKDIHRLIVTSNTYRMHSVGGGPDERRREIDPDNRYLSRMNVRRVEAEIVRDCVLQVAGNLETTMGGQEIDHTAGQTTPRRSVYFRHAYEKQMTFMKLFDAASVFECYRRKESIVPQQALALANSPISLSQSRLLARKVDAEADDAFITAAFEQVLTRTPTAEELEHCREFLAAQAERLAEPGKLTNFDRGPASQVKPAADPEQRARESLVHVLMNHNDFVTIR